MTIDQGSGPLRGGPGPAISSLPIATALIASAECLAGLGAFEWDLDHGTAWGSGRCLEIHGLDPGDALQPNDPKTYGRLVHPGDGKGVAELITRVAQGAPVQGPAEWRIVRGDGSVRRVRATASVVDGDDRRRGRVVGTLQDITDAEIAEIALGLHLAAGAATTGRPAETDPVTVLLGQLARPLAADFAVLWTLRGDVGFLEPQGCWSGRSVPAAGRLCAAVMDLKFGSGEGLPGRVWDRQTPLTLVDLVARDRHVRHTLPVESGLLEALAFPVGTGGTLSGVIELHFHRAPLLTAPLVAALAAVGDQLGDFFARHRGTFGRTPITEREREILQLAAEGAAISAIAASLAISTSTVKTHLEHLYLKLGVGNRPAAVAQGIRDGLIE